MCHSDIHLIDTGRSLKPPITLGHEIAGIVEETGASVTARRKGDRVTGPFMDNLRQMCLLSAGKDVLCESLFTLPWYGFSVDGGYAEYIRVSAEQVLPIPSEVPFDFAATLGCAGLSSYHAVNKARLDQGDNVAVYGVGGLAMYAIQFAKLKGTNVVAVGRNKEKLRKAERLGADQVVNAARENVGPRIREATKGKGDDVVISFVPGIDGTVLKNSTDGLANGGRIILVGVGPPFNFDYTGLVLREFSLSGSLAGTKGELAEVVELARNRRIESAVTKTVSLDQINQGFDLLRKGEILGRCVITT